VLTSVSDEASPFGDSLQDHTASQPIRLTIHKTSGICTKIRQEKKSTKHQRISIPGTITAISDPRRSLSSHGPLFRSYGIQLAKTPLMNVVVSKMLRNQSI
jgi:hypothetical protein